MKKTILLFSLVIATYLTSHSQTNFNRGFQEGYKKGYCYDKGIGCMSPNPPIAPIPKTGESFESYQDGYNRGFQLGQASNTNSNSNSASRQRYTTSQSESLDWVQKVDLSDAVAKGLALRELKEKAMNAMKLEDFNTSLEISKVGIRFLPKDWEFHYIKAMSNYSLENNDEAIKDFKKTISLTNDKEIIKELNSLIDELNSASSVPNLNKSNIENISKEDLGQEVSISQFNKSITLEKGTLIFGSPNNNKPIGTIKENESIKVLSYIKSKHDFIFKVRYNEVTGWVYTSRYDSNYYDIIDLYYHK